MTEKKEELLKNRRLLVIEVLTVRLSTKLSIFKTNPQQKLNKTKTKHNKIKLL